MRVHHYLHNDQHLRTFQYEEANNPARISLVNLANDQSARNDRFESF